MGRQCCITGKEGLPDGDAADLCFRAESGQIEEAPIRPCVKVHTMVVALEGRGEKREEEDPEQCRSEHTSLLDTTADWERLRRCSVVTHCALHVCVKGLYDGEQSWRAADLLQDVKQSAPAAEVKGLREINEGEVEGLVLFTAFLL